MGKNIKQQAIAIPPSAIAFLQLLKKNNNRDWFNKNKDRFLTEQHSIEKFLDALLASLHIHDLIETPSGKKLLARHIRFATVLPKLLNDAHDDHYHVDFTIR